MLQFSRRIHDQNHLIFTKMFLLSNVEYLNELREEEKNGIRTERRAELILGKTNIDPVSAVTIFKKNK